MSLRLRERQSEFIWIDDWPIRRPEPFISSAKYEAFKRALERYVQGEIPGRSFLIGGHRGSGKTALVRRAVEALQLEILEKLKEEAAKGGDEFRLVQPRRPLLVKLHGPSLIVDGLERKTSPAATQGTSAGSNDKPPKPPNNLLAQITIALYRALANEFERSFTVHAREVQRLNQYPMALEVAGQLKLDLDGAVDPATLRAYWQRVGRLDTGVLWPVAIGTLLKANNFADQGLREIVALTMASQAYQVCTGAVSYTDKWKDSATSEASAEAKGPFDFGRIIGGVGGLAVGGAVAVNSDELGGAGAAMLGVVSGLLTNFALTWSTKSTRSGERHIDYEFIRDRDVLTLDRDLPLVIQRVREAGLAPVFVIDELDKLEPMFPPDADPAPPAAEGPPPKVPAPGGGNGGATSANGEPDEPDTTIRTMISRLKHLTTDFGFFSFLTDRDYFERVHRKLELTAYPREHTYFSDKLFVFYPPEQIVDYVRNVIEPGVLDTHDTLAMSMLARFVTHRSELNSVNVERELAKLCKAGGELREAPQAIVGQLMYQLHAIVQLAIEHVMRQPATRLRMERDDLFAQLAADALYMISRAWFNDEQKLELNERALVERLLARVSVAMPAKTDDGVALLKKTYGEFDFKIVRDQVTRLAALLCDFDNLRRELSNDSQLSSHDIELLNALPGIQGGLLWLQDADAMRYAFRYDAFGRLLGEAATSGGTGELAPHGRDPTRFPEALQLVSFVDQLRAFLRQVDVELDDLVAYNLLPGSVSANEVENAVAAVRGAAMSGQQPDSALLHVLRSLEASFWEAAQEIATWLMIARAVALDAQVWTSVSTTKALGAIAQFISAKVSNSFDDLNNLVAAAARDVVRWADLVDMCQELGESRDISRWQEAFEIAEQTKLSGRSKFDFDPAVSRAWARWAERLHAFFVRGVASVATIDYDDFVLASAALPPSRLLCGDLDAVGVGDWTRMVLAATRTHLDAAKDGQFELYVGEVPSWCLIAGLLALGFSAPVLENLVQDHLTPPKGGSDELVPDLASWVHGARRYERAGTLIVMDDVLPNAPQTSRSIPILAVTWDDLVIYSREITW